MATNPLPVPRERRSTLPLALVSVILLSACGGCGGGNDNTTSASTGSTGSTGTGDAGGKVDRGPTTVALDADPNGLWWDAATGTLYIADSQGNRILGWTDAGGLEPVSGLPPAAGGASLGQVVKLASGELLVTSFGFGTAGALEFVMPDKTIGIVPNLDVTKRRIGLTVAADGTIYEGYFVKTASAQIGAVAKVDLTGSETDVITSLTKPVGVLASGASLVVSDQATNQVLVFPVATPTKPTVLVSQITGPDLLAAGPDGSFFTGGTTGDVRQIAADGTYTTFAGGFIEVRGCAYDAANKRLFAAEYDPSGAMDALHILPVN